jgi:ribosomal protein S18 acetylase RimI-like enzyme
VSLILQRASVEEGRALYQTMHELRYAEDQVRGGPALPMDVDMTALADTAEHLRVVHGAELVGRLALRDRTLGGEGALSIEAFWVEPRLRGQRLARQLFDLAEGVARARRYRLLTLEVAGSNIRAQRVYAAAGMGVRRRTFFIDSAAPLPVAPYEYRIVPGAPGQLRLSLLYEGREIGRVGALERSFGSARQVVSAEIRAVDQHLWTPSGVASVLSAAAGEGFAGLYLDASRPAADALAERWEPYYHELVKRL